MSTSISGEERTWASTASPPPTTPAGTAMNSSTASPNPWQDSESPLTPLTPQPLRVPPNLESSNANDKAPEQEAYEPHRKSGQQILDEFDPLVSQEESDARKAWESSEGNPPPPPVPSKDPKAQGDSPTSSSPPAAHEETVDSELPFTASTQTASPNESASSSTFPSLAALARSFSIPALPRPTRPVSLDSAKPVPSPDTLLSFARQQGGASKVGEVSERGKQKQRDEQEEEEETKQPEIEEHKGKGESDEGAQQSGSADGSGDSTSGDPPFDFQKFLDQMKTRSAEPVAKYLKSCVLFPNHQVIAVTWFN